MNPFDELPSQGGRPLRFWLMAEAFARAGWSVVYWTADFSHVSKRRRPPAAAGGAFPVKMVHEPSYRGNIGLRRLWAHWRWARNWRAAALREEPPDLIVASSPPLSSAREAERLPCVKSRRTAVIVDVMDAWPETFGRVAPGWALLPLKRLAAANYLSADAVTCVADAYAELVSAYGCRAPARRFYHGIPLGVPDVPRAPRAPRGGGPVVAYAGSLGRTYDLETAMEAVALIDGATLEIAGSGGREEALRRRAEDPRYSGKVRFAGRLDGPGLERFLARADIGLVPMSPESCVGIPYKMADYAKAGLAIASSLGGESEALVSRYGAGASYRAGDARGLADALRSLLPRLAEAGAAARRMAEREFDASSIYAGYVDFASAVCDKMV